MNDRNYYKCIKYFYSVRNNIESGVKRRNPSGIYKNVNICTCFLYIDFVCWGVGEATEGTVTIVLNKIHWYFDLVF
jgi:hypothetical protein